jgi:hypothetical protein
MGYRPSTMSTTGGRRTSRAFLALTVLFALVWLVSVAVRAPASGPAGRVATTSATGGATGRAAMVRQHRLLGGLVANRRDKSGRYGSTLLGMQPRALKIALLVAAGAGSPATVPPRQRTQPALVASRAPPLLQLGPDLSVMPAGALPGGWLALPGNVKATKGSLTPGSSSTPDQPARQRGPHAGSELV